jgi:biopolymer transport protein ExbD/biopolymer transport protein TolR
MGASLSPKSSKQPEPEINVTPLVDVVLVLLIIFMVIAPALNEGEHVELPEILTPDQKKKELEPIDLTLAANGNLVLDKQLVTEGELRSRLEALHAEDPERRILLKADTALPYGKVRDTFAMVQDVGFRGVSLKVLERKKQPDA